METLLLRKPVAIFVILSVILGICGCDKTKSNIDSQLEEAEYLLLKNTDSTLHMLESIEPIASKKELDRDSEQDALWALLKVWGLYRNYEKYIDEDLVDVAFDYFKESNNDLRRAQVYYLHSVVREDQGRGNEEEWAQDLYEACLSIAKTEDHVLAGQIYQRYAVKVSSRRDYEEAIKWDEKYLNEAQLSNSPDEQIIALINMSTSWMFVEDNEAKSKAGSTDGAIVSQYTNYPMAFKYIRQADSIATVKQLRSKQGRVYSRMSHFFSRLQVGDSALHYAILAKDIDEELYAKGKLHTPVTYMYVADAYRKLGNGDSALHYALKDVNNPSLINRSNASHLIYQIYHELLHDDAQTVIWQNRYFHQQDSLRIKDKAMAVNQVKQDNAVLVEKMKKEEKGLSWLVYILVALAIGLIARIVIGKRRHAAKLKKLEDEMNRLIEAKNNSEEKSTPQIQTQAEETPVVDEIEEESIETEVSFIGGTHETLTVPASSIIYVTSESNYLRVVYHQEGAPAKQRLIRMTMIQAEEVLSKYPRILRCHRAFIVNLDYVVHFSSGGGSYSLRLKDNTQSIPVSKTYLQTIRERISM